MNFQAPCVSIYFGVFLLAMYAWMWMKPVQADAVLRAFPRSIWPGRILISISVAWFAYNLNQVDLGRFNTLKIALWIAVPAGIYLITAFLPDLLSVRGLCTFCLLAGQSVLVAVRWHGFPASIAVALLVYAVMIKCMVLVVYPHFWIRGLDWMQTKPKFKKYIVSVGTGLGGVMILLGILSF